MGSLSLTASKPAQRKGFSPLVPGVFHVPYANCYRCPVNATPETCAAECLRFLEEQTLVHVVVARRSRRHRRRADPGRGRLRRASGRVSSAAARAGEPHGMLLIVDEVQSGMGRTGKWFAIEHTGVEPDMVATAKGIASGLPLGVVIARSHVMSWPPGAHASTFGGNPLSCAASLATIKLIREQLMQNAADVGAHLLAGVKALMGKHPIIGDVRGRGLMIGVELVRDRRTQGARAPPNAIASSASASAAACSCWAPDRMPSAFCRRWC